MLDSLQKHMGANHSDASEAKASDLAMLALGGVIALACASATGAAAILVVMEFERPSPATITTLSGGTTIAGAVNIQEITVPSMRATQSGECSVVAWKTGMSYCFRSEFGEANKAMRNSTATVLQAQTEGTTR